MRIIGCDLHARQQSVAMLDTETGELVNRTLKWNSPMVLPSTYTESSIARHSQISARSPLFSGCIILGNRTISTDSSTLMCSYHQARESTFVFRV